MERRSEPELRTIHATRSGPHLVKTTKSEIGQSVRSGVDNRAVALLSIDNEVRRQRSRNCQEDIEAWLAPELPLCGAEGTSSDKQVPAYAPPGSFN